MRRFPRTGISQTRPTRIGPSEDDQALADLFADLPEGSRRVLELRYRDGLEIDEIAERLDMTSETPSIRPCTAAMSEAEGVASVPADSHVEQLFDEWAASYGAARTPIALSYLERAGSTRRRPATLMDGFLRLAPRDASDRGDAAARTGMGAAEPRRSSSCARAAASVATQSSMP